jgi:Bacterial PH domain
MILFRGPRHWISLAALAGLFVWGLFAPAMLVVLVLILAANMFVRVRTWRAETVILTQKRIIRVQGVPETTRTEASLRLDRVSGARLIQTVLGKLFDYGTIELEAPGDHPDVRRLVRIRRPREFYAALRAIVFGEGVGPDPDAGMSAESTQPLPRLGPSSPRTR